VDRRGGDLVKEGAGEATGAEKEAELKREAVRPGPHCHVIIILKEKERGSPLQMWQSVTGAEGGSLVARQAISNAIIQLAVGKDKGKDRPCIVFFPGTRPSWALHPLCTSAAV
jgi:hypothetical protein